MNHDETYQSKLWNSLIDRGFLQSTIDPNDSKGLKVKYIDLWSRYYVKRYVIIESAESVLEIGCGVGRNLLALAPLVKQAYGIDIADKLIKEARAYAQQAGLLNIQYFVDPQEFFALDISPDVAFTMWVLSHFAEEANRRAMLKNYVTNLKNTERFVFFEQCAKEPYSATLDGKFYKRVHTKDQRVALFESVGLKVKDFAILNEKGFGPLYRRLYLGRLYRRWPQWLDINAIVFPIDRLLVRREIAERFTDCVFVCTRV
jgi:SAM-dependent methyltransferase